MKPYLIFVEGGNTPSHVHSTESSAYTEAYRLAEKFPDKEIMLLHIVKRLKHSDKKTQSLGSHIPDLTTKALVTARTLKLPRK